MCIRCPFFNAMDSFVRYDANEEMLSLCQIRQICFLSFGVSLRTESNV